MNKEIRREILEISFLVLLAIGIAVLIVTFVGQRTKVIGSSMEPTLNNNDQLIVYKFIYLYSKPQRKDVVVVWIPPQERTHPRESLYIKRVIGLPGETVEVKDSKVYINDKLLDEPYIPTSEIYPDFPKTSIPEGYVFVMGDNRGNSKDSRIIGPVPYKDVKGKAIFRFFPFNGFGKVK